MGQLCSRPRTIEDKHATDSVSVQAEPSHKQHTPFRPAHHHLQERVAQDVLSNKQGSDAELSELDVVVQQLHNNQNSVTGSAPDLLRQWDHDHRVVLESIDASIQVWFCFGFEWLSSLPDSGPWQG